MKKALIEHSRILFAVIGAIAGAVLGAVVQNALTSSFSFVMAIAGLISLGVLALLVSEAAREDSRRSTDEQIRGETKAIAEEVTRTHDRQRADLEALSTELTDAMNALGAQFGLRVGAASTI